MKQCTNLIERIVKKYLRLRSRIHVVDFCDIYFKQSDKIVFLKFPQDLILKKIFLLLQLFILCSLRVYLNTLSHPMKSEEIFQQQQNHLQNLKWNKLIRPKKLRRKTLRWIDALPNELFAGYTFHKISRIKHAAHSPRLKIKRCCLHKCGILKILFYILCFGAPFKQILDAPLITKSLWN